MTNLFTKILGDKKEWNAMEAHANELPRGYRIVLRRDEGLHVEDRHRRRHGNHRRPQRGARALRDQRGPRTSVLDVTGEDVAEFCHERLRGTSSSYLDKWRDSLNRDVAKKLAE